MNIRDKFQFSLHGLLVLIGIVTLGLVCLFVVSRQIGFVPFPKPPKVGERAEEMLKRLGPPHFDSREDGDSETNYRLGYTDGQGTRYHLTISNGVVVKVEYSSR